MAGGGIQVRKYPRDREHEKFIYNLLTHHRVSGAAAAAVAADGGVGREARLKCAASLRHRFILDGPLLVFFSLVCLAQMLVSGNKRCADTGSASFGRGGGGRGGNKAEEIFPTHLLSDTTLTLLPCCCRSSTQSSLRHFPSPFMYEMYLYRKRTKKGEMGAEEVTQAISQNRGPQCDM